MSVHPTEANRIAISTMRAAGTGLKKIAGTLGVCKRTLKRHYGELLSLRPTEPKPIPRSVAKKCDVVIACLNCGRPVAQLALGVGRLRRLCSKKCRREHATAQRRKYPRKRYLHKAAIDP